MSAYYNENDKFAANWLRNLIKKNLIAPGHIDERSIEDVTPADLSGFTQCHFFAGIGAWSYALRRAGWPDDKSIWTGSCPCQPFSAAGKRKGVADKRHLWPAFHWLIHQCRPGVVFGEQVAGRDGAAWFDLVSTDMEGDDYACGAVVAPACGFGAPHNRSRMYWVAYANSRQRDRIAAGKECVTDREATGRIKGDGIADADCEIDSLADSYSNGCGQRAEDEDGGAQRNSQGKITGTEFDGDADRLANANSQLRGLLRGREPEITGCSEDSIFGNATNGFWRNADWLSRTDGFWAPVEPGTFPLADRPAARVGFVCADCQTETMRYENMCILWEIGGRHKRRFEEKILRQKLLQTSQVARSVEEQKQWPLSSKEGDIDEKMRKVRLNEKHTGSSQRQESTERLSFKLGGVMFEMPQKGARIYKTFDLRCLRDHISSAESSQQEQNMFCPLCERVGTHKCDEKMVGRVGRLRGYGNAIVADQAKAFVRAYMEARP